MLRHLKISAIFLAAVFAFGQPSEAAPKKWARGSSRVIVQRPLVVQRPVIVRPHYYPRPYYGWGFGYGYGPGWYDPWYRPAYVFPQEPSTGEVKLVTHFKEALVYVDGGYAGVAGKLKHFDLSPGNHDIELRDPAGREIFHERVQVILGKTAEIHVD